MLKTVLQIQIEDGSSDGAEDLEATEREAMGARMGSREYEGRELLSEEEQEVLDAFVDRGYEGYV